jgi:biotin operon repressor
VIALDLPAAHLDRRRHAQELLGESHGRTVRPLHCHLVSVKSSRLLSTLLLLQTRGRLTAARLAAELEVSVRTVYRDIESLHAAGIPLYGEAGHSGGYELLAGYRTRLTGLSAPEAEALFLSGVPGPAAELGFGSALAAAQLKLRAALPPDLRDQADRMRRRFNLDAPGWYAPDDDVRPLPRISTTPTGRSSRWARMSRSCTRRSCGNASPKRCAP